MEVLEVPVGVLWKRTFETIDRQQKGERKKTSDYVIDRLGGGRFGVTLHLSGRSVGERDSSSPRRGLGGESRDLWMERLNPKSRLPGFRLRPLNCVTPGGSGGPRVSNNDTITYLFVG